MAKLLILAFLSAVFLTGEICSGLFNFNLKVHVCKYKKIDNVVYKRSDLCSEGDRRCRRLFGWFAPKPKPKPKPPSNEYEDCCQGWTGYHHIFGCRKQTCVGIPQHVGCRIRRGIHLGAANLFNKLTKPLSEPLAYPTKTQNLFEAVPFPLLDQPPAKVLGRSAFVSSLHEQDWLVHYVSMAGRLKIDVENRVAPGNQKPFKTYWDYAQILKTMRKEQANPIISFKIPFTPLTFKGIEMEQYMRYPSQELPFKDIIANEAWKEDDVFTMQRLAGLNPMSLRKMTNEDFNQDFVNKDYNWDAAMQRASGESTTTFSQMIAAGRVFIIDYKLLHGLTNVEDYTERNTTDRREMAASRSPFCTFVTANVGGSKELKPVAIQTDLNKGAPVFSPVDGSKWMKAKMEIQRADLFYVELIEHLLKSHILMEPICVIMRRTLSKFHPLHEMLKWHCRGLAVTNSLGLGFLLNKGEFLHKLFAFGHIGAAELLNKAYPYMSWADTEFDKNLERRGVNNVEELPYFPYRDDGLIIWKEIGDFIRDYVKLYYYKDSDVANDPELRDFANELSADGSGRNGGIGKFKGFPNKIRTRPQLIQVLRRIVFIVIQHHAVNYPVAYYGAFIPNQASKLYDDPRVPPQEYGLASLPQGHVTTEQIGLAFSLGSIRYDVLLDYGDHLQDGRGKAVVNKYHARLIKTINKQISARNQERYASGKLTYPYFLPKWMPNSIHT